MKNLSFHYNFNNDAFYDYKLDTESGMAIAVRNSEIPFDSQCHNMHWHDYFEIEIIVNGKGIHRYDKKSDELGYGSAYIVIPAEQHSVISSTEEPLHICHIRFNENAVYRDAILSLLSDGSCVSIKFDKEKMEVLMQQVNLLYMCMAEPSMFQENLIKHIISLICIFILQGSKDNNEKNIKTDDINLQAIQDTMLYIRCHFREKITMEELAKRTGYTKNYLSTIFKRGTGYSCIGYARYLRVQYACNLIRTTSLSLENIAYESGFSSLSHFVMQFHKIKGITPNEYKKLKAIKS